MLPTPFSALWIALLGLAPWPAQDGSQQRAAPPPSAWGNVLVVDDEPVSAAPFREIQAAIDAALDGDLILVNSGRYRGFTIDGKSLAVVLDSGASLYLDHDPAICVRNLALDQAVLLRGFRGDPFGGFAHWAVLEDNEGSVWIEDCLFRIGGAREFALDITRSRAVDLARVEVPSAILLGTRDAVRVLDSSVRIHDSGLHGASSDSDFFFPSGSGGAGLRLRGDSQAFVSGCSAVGGAGALALCGTGWPPPSNGGPGVAVEDVSSLTILDCDLVGGAGGEAFGSCASGQPGAPYVGAPGSTITLLAGERRSTHVLQAVARAGGAVDLLVAGAAGEEPFVATSSSAGAVFVLAWNGFFLLGLPLDPGAITLAPLPPSGAALHSVNVPAPPRGRTGRRLWVQAAFVDPRTGSVSVGGASAAAVVDHGIRPLLNDCNGNASDDALDLASSLELDCNRNGMPDACELAQGIAQDCDRNGIPDDCDATALASIALRPASGAALDGGLAFDGRMVVVGAPLDDVDVVLGGAGSVNVFVRDPATGWPATETLRLVSPHPSIGYRFGTSLALDGSTLVVGEPFANPAPIFKGPGAVHVFVRQGAGWTHSASLYAGGVPVTSLEEFGAAVAIEGDTLAVIGRKRNTLSVYRREASGSWLLEDEPRPTLGFPSGLLRAVLVRGGQLFVLIPDAVVVYEREPDGTWTEVQRLTPGPPCRPFSLSALSVEGERMAVGLANDDRAFPGAGSAAIFERRAGRWEPTVELFPSDDSSIGSFGRDLALEGGTLAVLGGGSISCFERDPHGVWNLSGKVLPCGSAFRIARAGGALAVGGTSLVSGASANTVCVLAVADCNGNGILDSCDLASGTSEDADGNGFLDECEGIRSVQRLVAPPERRR